AEQIEAETDWSTIEEMKHQALTVEFEARLADRALALAATEARLRQVVGETDDPKLKAMLKRIHESRDEVLAAERKRLAARLRLEELERERDDLVDGVYERYRELREAPVGPSPAEVGD
ncbi:MAG: hypothetical protein R3336_10360, partial [Phycisphaeraceae bacterium]|nr:hypothetical protein [Phycisphaeraceae bacterium]